MARRNAVQEPHSQHATAQQQRSSAPTLRGGFEQLYQRSKNLENFLRLLESILILEEGMRHPTVQVERSRFPPAENDEAQLIENSVQKCLTEDLEVQPQYQPADTRDPSQILCLDTASDMQQKSTADVGKRQTYGKLERQMEIYHFRFHQLSLRLMNTVGESRYKELRLRVKTIKLSTLERDDLLAIAEERGLDVRPAIAADHQQGSSKKIELEEGFDMLLQRNRHMDMRYALFQSALDGMAKRQNPALKLPLYENRQLCTLCGKRGSDEATLFLCDIEPSCCRAVHAHCLEERGIAPPPVDETVWFHPICQILGHECRTDNTSYPYDPPVKLANRVFPKVIHDVERPVQDVEGP